MNEGEPKSCDDDQIFDHNSIGEMKNYAVETYNDQIFDQSKDVTNQRKSSKQKCDLISDQVENENGMQDFRVIPRNFFPKHTSVNEAHLLQVYGNKIMKEPANVRHKLMQSMKILKSQVISKIKQKLKDRMVKVANERKMTYYNEKGQNFHVRLYHDIKQSFGTDIRRNNLENIFHVCYGNFDIDKGWLHTFEHEVMRDIGLKYSDLENTSSGEVKFGRPQSNSLVTCIAIAKNDLVKGIMKFGSARHGVDLKVKHTKGRNPGIFDDLFIKKKKF